MVIKLVITVQLAVGPVNLTSPAIPDMAECLAVVDEMVANAQLEIGKKHHILAIKGECIEFEPGQFGPIKGIQEKPAIAAAHAQSKDPQDKPVATSPAKAD